MFEQSKGPRAERGVNCDICFLSCLEKPECTAAHLDPGPLMISRRYCLHSLPNKKPRWKLLEYVCTRPMLLSWHIDACSSRVDPTQAMLLRQVPRSDYRSLERACITLQYFVSCSGSRCTSLPPTITNTTPRHTTHTESDALVHAGRHEKRRISKYAQHKQLACCLRKWNLRHGGSGLCGF